MNRPSLSSLSGLSRRTALGRVAAVGAAVGLGSRVGRVAAQDAATEMANHPLVGTWLAGANVNELGLVHWDADGNSTMQGGSIATGPDGALTFSGSAMGFWEPVSERGIHLTFTWQNRDATGAVTGTVTVDGYPVANEDGMSFWDDGTQVVVTLRDPTGAVTQVINTVPRVAGVRVTPGKPGYEEALAMLATPSAATPETGTPTA
jgi:hypothetical protein